MVGVFYDMKPCEHLFLKFLSAHILWLVLHVEHWWQVAFLQMYFLKEEVCL